MSSAAQFLTFSCKRTEQIEVKRPILSYVLRTYGTEQAASITDDINEVSRRRSEVVVASNNETMDKAHDILLSYYKALTLMETRFPISYKPAHAQVQFAWTSSSVNRKWTGQININFEKASVLYNIAAICSRKACVQNRNDQEGYKTAIQCFQEASGLFNLIRDLTNKVDNPKPTDLTAEYLTLAEKLMLAQGQECVFWRARKDFKSPSTLSKVAKGASQLYSEALRLAKTPLMREELDKGWKDSIKTKTRLFETLCQYNAAEEAQLQENIGVEIARLKRVVILMQKLKKNARNLAPSLSSFVKELNQSIAQNLTNAEKSNASVFFKHVPEFSELPSVDGVQIVKGVVPTDALDASNETLFRGLIPEHVTRSLSRYAELVDRLIRQEIEKLNGATDEARIKLRQYELPEILDSISTADLTSLPEFLQNQLTEIKEGNGVIYLEETSQQIGELREKALKDLDRIEENLNDEAAIDVGLKEQHGQNLETLDSASETIEFRKRIDSYREYLASAFKSDIISQEKLKENRDDLGSLAIQRVLERMPKLETKSTSFDSIDPSALVTNIRTCLTRFNSFSEERAGLEDALKELKSQDDLLNKLSSTGAETHDQIFTVELEKYNPLKKEVDENLQKQKQLLEYLTPVFADFQQIYDMDSWKQRMSELCKELKTNVSQKLDKGFA